MLKKNKYLIKIKFYYFEFKFFLHITNIFFHNKKWKKKLKCFVQISKNGSTTVSNFQWRTQGKQKNSYVLSRLFLLSCKHHDRANFEVSLGPSPWLLGLPTYLNISVTLKLKSIVFTAIVTDLHIHTTSLVVWRCDLVNPLVLF